VQIESFLVKDLGALGPSLQSLTKHVVASLAAFAGVVLTKANVKAFGDDIQHLADFMGTKQFQSDLIGFGKGVGLVASEIIAVAHKLEWLLPTTKAQKIAQQRDVLHGEYERAKGTSRAAYFKKQYDNFNAAHPVVTVPPVIAHGKPGLRGAELAPFMPDIRRASRETGTPVSLLTGQLGAESSANANAVNHFIRAGVTHRALGGWQMTRGTWDEYAQGMPFKDATNPAIESVVAARYDAALLKKARGDMQSVMHHYTGNPTGSAASAAYGDKVKRWGNAGDRENRAYLKALNSHKATATQTIHITNSTGAKVSHQVNAASHS